MSGSSPRSCSISCSITGFMKSPGAGGRRVRRPELLQAEPGILRLSGGEKGLCPLPGPQHHDLEDRGLRRGSRRYTTSFWILRPTSGSPTSAIPPGAGSGTPAAPTPSRPNVALVHNGDFANYFAVSEYLSQRHFYPQFLTDTEVAVLLFDLWHRLYGYPLEYVIEALAPTTERDFDLLPPQTASAFTGISSPPASTARRTAPGSSSSPGTTPPETSFELIGITDTSMLRPQVFALQKAKCRSAWCARRSRPSTRPSPAWPRKTPGSARWRTLLERPGRQPHRRRLLYLFPGKQQRQESPVLPRQVRQSQDRALVPAPLGGLPPGMTPERYEELAPQVEEHLRDAQRPGPVSVCHQTGSPNGPMPQFLEFLKVVEQLAPKDDDRKAAAIEALTLLLDRRYDTGEKKRSHLLRLLQEALARIFRLPPKWGSNTPAAIAISTGRAGRAWRPRPGRCHPDPGRGRIPPRGRRL